MYLANIITSELANQHTRKVLFTCGVYTNTCYSPELGTQCTCLLDFRLKLPVVDRICPQSMGVKL